MNEQDPYLKRYRIREVSEYIVEAYDKLDALDKFQKTLPKQIASEIRVRTENEQES